MTSSAADDVINTCFQQHVCKIFPMKHAKATKMKKRCTLFYVMAYVIKGGKGNQKKHRV
jgi:hypothetical protein